MAASKLCKPDLNQVAESLDQLSTLPDVTRRIMQAADDPRSDAFQLVKIVSHDPALASRLIKLVNSPLFGIRQPVSSLERAIPLLGLKVVKNLAVAAGFSGMFQGKDLCEGFGPRDLWTHSVGVAVCARELSLKMNLPITDEVFLIGLLHDLGLLALHQQFPAELRTICERSKSDPGHFCEIELDVIGFDHQQLGEAIAARWKFPPLVRNAIAHHHHPAHAPAEHRAHAAVIYVADTICCQMNEGFNLTAARQTVDLEILALVPLTEEVINATREQLHDLIRLTSPFAA